MTEHSERREAQLENRKIKVAFCWYWRINRSATRSASLSIQSGCSSGVERNLAKVDVVGSNPIIRSIFYCESVLAADFFVAQKGGRGWESVFKRVGKEPAVKCR